ncbi:helix-turn-helix domain-containing protein [Cryobacterium sp. 5B3]|uniref:helix-turn-helix domain-containing protein n=1 Tax=Cryobacterium sp. 5B3 TaxID=3048586 RepID=UPI002AB55F1A|nr:helix-turn-helix domain-containing protein [Cryobacterium sp. 5B3]MDY7541797.1 helix-turn-helix domain-containing protein [Cryobacterium sp. 5B3]MEB0275223.1 helix-turn-helix domain-containing protein [Cryobacterium sp. 5B3]
MLSVKEYAARQDISVGRVHQLIREGKVPAEKVGSSWVIDESALSRQPPLSRPLSQANAWSFIALLSGLEPEHLDPTAHWRLALKNAALAKSRTPAPLLSSWLCRRAPVLALQANANDLADLRSDERVVLSGISDDRAGLSSEHEVEAYVDPEVSKDLIREFLLIEAKHAKNANVWLHLARVDADADGRAPLGLVLADLADHAGPRESARVKELLSSR